MYKLNTLLAAAIAATALVGCGDNSSDSAADSGQPSSTITEKASDLSQQVKDKTDAAVKTAKEKNRRRR